MGEDGGRGGGGGMLEWRHCSLVLKEVKWLEVRSIFSKRFWSFNVRPSLVEGSSHIYWHIAEKVSQGHGGLRGLLVVLDGYTLRTYRRGW